MSNGGGKAEKLSPEGDEEEAEEKAEEEEEEEEEEETLLTEAEIQEELEALRTGKHTELLIQFEALKRIRNADAQECNLRRTKRLAEVEHLFRSERKQADETFEAGKISIRTQMIEALLRKKRKLSSDWNDGVEATTKRRPSRTRGRKDSASKSGKVLTAKDGGAKFVLSHDEIQDDIGFVKRELAQQEKDITVPAAK
eukprot:gb/GEZN01008295.1/.p1 GENE.gb/GEZN01008295.1/~~gb/GEZN01008295.1/.p1  ORF type:complete len:198 (+),score=58.71 gb/GEZN01008295.1/:253-846(+)